MLFGGRMRSGFAKLVTQWRGRGGGGGGVDRYLRGPYFYFGTVRIVVECTLALLALYE